MLARIVRTRSYGASTEPTWVVSMVQSAPSNVMRAPSFSITFAIVFVSDSRGTLRSLCTPGASSAAAITGSAAFFAPLIGTRPESFRPP
jgi:hypothetical protein